jgi:hypothetical protein
MSYFDSDDVERNPAPRSLAYDDDCARSSGSPVCETRTEPGHDDNVALSYDDIDSMFPSDPRGRVRLSPTKKRVLAALAGYLTGRRKYTTDKKTPRKDREDILYVLKTMLFDCYSQADEERKDKYYTEDADCNRKEARMGRIVYTYTIESLGNQRLGLDDENVFPSPHGFGISKCWPGVVVHVLPKGYIRQRISSKEGKGLTLGAQQNDYHAKHNIRLAPDDPFTRRQWNEKWGPLRIVDAADPKRWADNALTSTTEYVSFEQPSSWQDAYIKEEDWSEMFEMKVDAAFDYGEPLATGSGRRIVTPRPQVLLDRDNGKRARTSEDDGGPRDYPKNPRHAAPRTQEHIKRATPYPKTPTTRTETAAGLEGLRMGNDTATSDMSFETQHFTHLKMQQSRRHHTNTAEHVEGTDVIPSDAGSRHGDKQQATGLFSRVDRGPDGSRDRQYPASMSAEDSPVSANRKGTMRSSFGEDSTHQMTSGDREPFETSKPKPQPLSFIGQIGDRDPGAINTSQLPSGNTHATDMSSPRSRKGLPKQSDEFRQSRESRRASGGMRRRDSSVAARYGYGEKQAPYDRGN